MTTICLVRHGETDWNRLGKYQGREDVPLNDTGRDQARVTGRFLSRSAWDAIVSSHGRASAAPAPLRTVLREILFDMVLPPGLSSRTLSFYWRYFQELRRPAASGMLARAAALPPATEEPK